VPQPFSRRRVREFQQAFAGEVDSLAALYRNAAADMLEVLADAAAFAGQRARAAALLHQYQVILADLDDEAAAWIELNVPRAYGAGLEFVDGCVADYRRAGINLREVTGRASAMPESAVFAQVHREAAWAVTQSMLDVMSGAAQQIGRRVEDAFRREGLLAVSQGIVEGRTRVEVSRALEQRLRELGRPDFVDKLGRHWRLDQYAEMVARTTTREAMTQGTIQRLREHGIQLAQVSSHSCTDFCVYYQGVIVCIGDEPHPVYPPLSAINGGPPFHPRCSHSLTPLVERLANEGEMKARVIAPEPLNRSPAELQRRYGRGP
jgi:hypothetical protein